MVHSRLRTPVRRPAAYARSLLFACVFAVYGCESEDAAPAETVDSGTDNAGSGDDIDGSTDEGTTPKPMDAGPTRPGSAKDGGQTRADAADVDPVTDASASNDDSGALPSLDASTDGGNDDAGQLDAGSSDAGKADAGRADAGRDASSDRCGSRGSPRCGPREFCNFEPDSECGATDRGGMCERRPEACTQQYDPVCGCDGRTYGNACSAHSAGISIARDGECDDTPGPTGKMCGGFAGIACDDGQFCNYEAAAGGQGCENIADGAGVCQPSPSACTRDYRPVCGCNRHTYANVCEAHRAGLSVLREDACTELDCEAIGGDVVTGFGPPAVCPQGTVSAGSVRFTSGQIPIEGALCCIDR